MIFFALNLFFAVIIWLFYPETSGRTLEELDAIYLGDNDRLFVVDKRGRLLPGFAGRYNHKPTDGNLEAGEKY